MAETGSEVFGVRAGDLVVAPFMWSDGTCDYCREGLTTSCEHGGFWGSVGYDGGQGEAVRVPFADGTLVKLPKDAASDARLLAALLTPSDVMRTGHHAALAAGARPGATVAVVGDGAVGLCAVLAAERPGAERIVALGRHEVRTDIARAFGATDVVAERREAAVEAVRELTRGQGAHAVVEAVGTEQSMRTAVSIARDGGAIGFVGVPHGRGCPQAVQALGEVPDSTSASCSTATSPRAAASRRSGPPSPNCSRTSWMAAFVPSPVFDMTVGLDQVPEGYKAMDERVALKVMVTP